MTDARGPSFLRFATVNLFAQHGDWERRRTALRESLRALDSWPWWAERERELQAVAVVRRIEELVDDGPAHVVLGGDFNAEPQAASMRFLTGRQSLDGISTAYRDAWESVHGEAAGWTFDPANPLTVVDEPGLDRGRRIDYVLVRCGDHGPTLGIVDAGLAVHEPVDGVQPSDHYGVYADLAPREAAMPDTSAAGNPAGR
jgi:endonuclease/exonuclease/phosphatase family metal-dependent hydrolase